MDVVEGYLSSNARAGSFLCYIGSNLYLLILTIGVTKKVSRFFNHDAVLPYHQV